MKKIILEKYKILIQIVISVVSLDITDRMDPAISFPLCVRMDTYQVALDGSTRRCSKFDYPLIVELSMNFNEVQRAMCNKDHGVMNDTVVVRYLDRDTNCYVDV
jgi:hypothetical protein